MSGQPIKSVDEIVEDLDQTAAQPAPGEPDPRGASPKAGKRRGGPPLRNQNATKTGKRSKLGHAGSKLHEKLGTAEDHVARDMKRVLDELAQLHPEWVLPDGSLKLSSAVDATLMRLRRAYERDRVASTLLMKLEDLKGNSLSLSEQAGLRKSQDEALACAQECLEALGLGDAAAPSGQPEFDSEEYWQQVAKWERVYERQRQQEAAQAAAPAEEEEEAGQGEGTDD